MTANKFWNENIATIKTLCIEITLNCAPNTASNLCYITAHLLCNIEATFTVFYCILYGVQNCDHVLYSIFAPKMNVSLNYRKYV